MTTPTVTTSPFENPLDHAALRQHHTTNQNMKPFAILYTTEGDDKGVIVQFENMDPELLSGVFHKLFLDHHAQWADLYVEGLSNIGPDEEHIKFALQAGLIKSRTETPANQQTLMQTRFTPEYTIVNLYSITTTGAVDLEKPIHQHVLEDPTTHPLGIMPFNLI